MGRRLYTDARRYFLGTMIVKLHLWSLTRYKRLGFLDLDVVIVNNLDSLLALPVSYGSIAAVPAKACKRMNVFNGGVLVFAPHREVLRAMLFRACVYFWKATHGVSPSSASLGLCNAYRLGRFAVTASRFKKHAKTVMTSPYSTTSLGNGTHWTLNTMSCRAILALETPLCSTLPGNRNRGAVHGV